MTWDESRHRRDADGQFTHSTIGAWALKAAGQLGALHGLADTSRSLAAAKRGEHPPGWAAARGRALQLWGVPDRRKGIERTDAQQAELDGLEAAFAHYREHLGLEHDYSAGNTIFKDEEGHKYTEHGAYLGRLVTSEPPASLRRGFTRVGEHPTGFGSVHGSSAQYGTPSTHPWAGGVWINPKNPGTRHAPRYLDDLGHGISEMRPEQHRSEKHKRFLQSDRYENPQHSNENVEHETVWRGKRRPGQLGYGTMQNDKAGEFVVWMKRVKARARVEAAPKTQVRRTPRGTRVEGWMGAR